MTFRLLFIALLFTVGRKDVAWGGGGWDGPVVGGVGWGGTMGGWDDGGVGLGGVGRWGMGWCTCIQLATEMHSTRAQRTPNCAAADWRLSPRPRNQQTPARHYQSWTVSEFRSRFRSRTALGREDPGLLLNQTLRRKTLGSA